MQAPTQTWPHKCTFLISNQIKLNAKYMFSLIMDQIKHDLS